MLAAMGDLSGRYAACTQRLVKGVLAAPGQTPSDLRRAIEARAARLGGRRTPVDRGGGGRPGPACRPRPPATSTRPLPTPTKSPPVRSPPSTPRTLGYAAPGASL